MKKVICLVLIALFVLTTTAAFAGQSSSSSAKPEGGWQRLYEDVEAWSTDADEMRDKTLRGTGRKQRKTYNWQWQSSR